MYKVLIVDDEVLILSGIKYLIDWKSIDCNLIEVANNGEQALSLIDEFHPDIVISDINMPILNGLELLKKCNELYPLSTFIMLTCLEEFSLIKEALKYNAVDYLLKSELNSKNLIQSIEKAKAECKIRQKYFSLDMEDLESNEKDNKIIKNILSRINLPQEINPKQINYLCSKDILNNYFIVQINIEYPFFEENNSFSKEDFKRIYEYQGELNLRLAKSYFSNLYQVEVSRPAPYAYLYFFHNVSKARYETNLPILIKKMNSISKDVTGVKSYVISTALYENYKQIEECKNELSLLRNSFFNIEKNIIDITSIKKYEYKPIIFNAYIDRISSALKTKNINDFRYYMNKINSKLIEYNYIRGEAVVFLDELISNALVYLKIELPNEVEFPFHQDLLSYIPTKDVFLKFFNNFNKTVEQILLPYLKEKDSYIEKAKKYIHENITKRIMLDDIANEIGVSSGYLSATFSKQCEISISEYINKVKVDEAIKLIKQKPYKIYEICNELGFDNSYYFSRVFKKNTGKTLSAFMNSIKYE